ncbi:MAG: DUF4126 domain-containing protein, partial [Thermoanaerobaculia bacterium]|nr:DUF4126 domain-containing protein [Thermoanaerobaculia bacterium]
KASLRGASTASTGGLGNPILSLLEDVFAFLQAILAIFLPWVVLVLFLIGVLVLVVWVGRRAAGA